MWSPAPTKLLLRILARPRTQSFIVRTTGYECTKVDPQKTVANVDYSACTGLTTSVTTSTDGAVERVKCLPQCKAGYEASTLATTIDPLECDATGKFDGSNTLVCNPATCQSNAVQSKVS